MPLTASFPVAIALLCTCASAAVFDGHAAKLISMPQPAFRRLTTESAISRVPSDHLSSRVIDLTFATPLSRDGESAVEIVLPTTEHQSNGDDNCAFNRLCMHRH
eukprot:IDg19628t1